MEERKRNAFVISPVVLWIVSVGEEKTLWNTASLKQGGFFQIPQHGSTTGDCAPYNHRCYSKASKSQRTGDAVGKFSVWFFLPFLFRNEEKPLKEGLFVPLEESNAFV